MKEATKKLEKSAEELEHLTDRTNLALAEMRLQFETLTEMQKEEREAISKSHQEENERMRKHYGKIIAGLILSLLLLIGGIVGSLIYVFTNYDLQTYTFTQDMNIGGAGTNTINDGLHFNVGE